MSQHSKSTLFRIFRSLEEKGLIKKRGRVKTFTIRWYDWDESGTNREIRGTTGANDIIFFRQANKDLNGLINKKAIIRKGEKKEYITNLYNMPTLCQLYANLIYFGKGYLKGLGLSTLVRKKGIK